MLKVSEHQIEEKRILGRNGIGKPEHRIVGTDLGDRHLCDAQLAHDEGWRKLDLRKMETSKNPFRLQSRSNLFKGLEPAEIGVREVFGGLQIGDTLPDGASLRTTVVLPPPGLPVFAHVIGSHEVVRVRC